MEVKFKINEFEGPLDLLLHLIKENKMDIMDIDIVKITDQYTSYLQEQEKMNLEITSEYLVLAAELMEIKSKLLLPNSESEEEEDVDPRSELVERLLEYEAYKEITKVLHNKEELRKEIYTKAPEDIKNYLEDGTTIKSDVTLDDLVEAFKRYLERKKDEEPLNTKVTVNEISIASRRSDIRKILKARGRVSFFELFPVVTKEYVIATFLAILDMAKNRELVINQDKAFDDIICEVIN